MQICNNCKESFDMARIVHPICWVSYGDDRGDRGGTYIHKLDYCKHCVAYLSGGNMDAFHDRHRTIVLQPRDKS